MADKRISELSALTGALNVADALPISDDSASQTKKISPKALLERAFVLIDDNSIPASKLDSTGSVPPGGIGTTELADGSVTATKLADNSSGIVVDTLPDEGVRVGQVALDTSNNHFYVWSGSAWVPVVAGGSVNTVTGANNSRLRVVITQEGDTVSVETQHVNTTAAAQFLAGPSNGAGQVTARSIQGTDLPTAGASSKGAIAVNGEGLRVDGTQLEIDNDITANNAVHLCEYNSKGLVTNSRAIEPADLPIATDKSVGVVMPQGDLVVGDGGGLTLGNKGVEGSYTKVTCNSQGVITAGSTLTNDDLPDINADKITGTLDGATIADRSLEEIKLSDFSTCLIQEGQPSGDYKLGQFWFTPSTSRLRVYGRGSDTVSGLWYSIGFGALQAQNLRWAGTVNASSGLITTLTDIGVSEGLTAGSPIPNPTDELSGLYFVVDTAGTGIGIPNVNNENCTEGDWILYINQAQGATHLDVSAGGGGGGGGGATKLSDLTDVDIESLQEGQALMYDDISGKWKNTSVISGGTF